MSNETALNEEETEMDVNQDQKDNVQMSLRFTELNTALTRLEKIAKKPKIVTSSDAGEQGEYIKLLEDENLEISKKLNTVLNVQKALEKRCHDLEDLLSTAENEVTGVIHEIDELIAFDSIN